MTDLPWAIYTRVSTDDQAKKGISLDAQLESCRCYAKARGWTVGKECIEPGITGSTMKRPALQDLLAEVKAGKLGGVIVWKLERLSRIMDDVKAMHRLLAEANTDLASVTENIDTTTPSGRLFFHMLASFNEYDRDNIRERIKAAMTHLRAQGFWTGGHVPPGCQLVAAGERRKLVEDPAVAPLVRPLWSWILAGDGLNVSARRLQDAGVPAPGYVGKASRRGWTPAQAWNLVRSPQVTGILVDAATQAAAIQALAGRKTPVRRGSTPKPGARATVASIVAGLLRCPMCGSSMVQATVKQKYRYFRCCLANKNRSLCRQKDPRVEMVEAAVVESLEEAINGGRYRDSLLQAKQVSIAQVQEARAAKIRLTSEREQLAGRIAHLARTGQVGTAGFNLVVAALGDEAKAIDRRLAEADAILAVRGVDADNIVLALDTIAQALVRFQAADCSPVERAAILRHYIDKIEVHPDRVKLWMYQPNPSEHAKPPAFDRGFAPIAGFGTPGRTVCKRQFVLVEVPRQSSASAVPAGCADRSAARWPVGR
jgi:site-specific DNA recombinase